MLDQRVADGEDSAALSQDRTGVRFGAVARGKPMIERCQPFGCGGAVSLSKKLERCVELRGHTPSRSDAAKVDDLGPDRQGREELCALERLGLVR
jgi:hypothetical protein